MTKTEIVRRGNAALLATLPGSYQQNSAFQASRYCWLLGGAGVPGGVLAMRPAVDIKLMSTIPPPTTNILQ
eukprot:scaffold128137_cov18-Tisochrysis_lutea.AAC.1